MTRDSSRPGTGLWLGVGVRLDAGLDSRSLLPRAVALGLAVGAATAWWLGRERKP